MIYAVLLRLDSTGTCPVIVTEDSMPPPGERGVRYRFVAQTDDEAEAVRLVDILRGNLKDRLSRVV